MLYQIIMGKWHVYKNFYVVVGLLGLTTVISFAAVSCNKKAKAPDMQQHLSYIAEREFSISAYDSGDTHLGSGTAWICENATDSAYTYYLTTNYHVTENWVSSSFSYLYFYFIDGSEASSHKTFDTGKNIENGNYGFAVDKVEGDITIQEATGLYSSVDKVEAASNPLQSADVSLLKVSFDNVVTTNPTLRNKLDKLNADANIVDYRNEKPNKTDWTYIGGFGLNSTGDGKFLEWQYTADKIYKVSHYKNTIDSDVTPHWIEHNSTIKDVSSTYWYPTGNMEQTLKPGTSGSIAIDQNYKVSGIHWGEFITHNHGYESVVFLTENGLDIRLNNINVITVLKEWINAEV